MPIENWEKQHEIMDQHEFSGAIQIVKKSLNEKFEKKNRFYSTEKSTKKCNFKNRSRVPILYSFGTGYCVPNSQRIRVVCYKY